MLVLLLVSPMPAEMEEAQAAYRQQQTTVVATAASSSSRPVAYAPGDDRSDPTALTGQLDESQMVALIGAFFPAEWRTWALNVSWCESRWNTWAVNPRSTAAGLWQFLRSTWDWVAGETGTGSYDSGAVFDAHANALNAAWLVTNEGPQHWVCKG